MATQDEQLSATVEEFEKFVPEELRKPVLVAIEDFRTSFDPKNAIQVGEKLPAFNMSDATGQPVDSAGLLTNGPLLTTFYRGEWCPYCNIAVAFLQKHLAEFQAKGVGLVAISPELPNHNMTMTEKQELKFPVLTDLHNELARKLGIVYNQSPARALHKDRGINLKARNGDDTWEIPIPATILVDRHGVVRNTWIEPDYTKRLDPALALGWLDALEK
ncbi:hypothetical protein SCUP515_01704 [Seiridium cupressi]